MFKKIPLIIVGVVVNLGVLWGIMKLQRLFDRLIWGNGNYLDVWNFLFIAIVVFWFLSNLFYWLWVFRDKELPEEQKSTWDKP